MPGSFWSRLQKKYKVCKSRRETPAAFIMNAADEDG